MSLLCRIFGHKGAWSTATVHEGYWYSICRLCDAEVRRSGKGGPWIVREQTDRPFNGWAPD